MELQNAAAVVAAPNKPRRRTKRLALVKYQLGLLGTVALVAGLATSLSQAPTSSHRQLDAAADEVVEDASAAVTYYGAEVIDPTAIPPGAVAESADASLITLVLGEAGCGHQFDMSGGLYLYIALMLYTFVGLAIVCDEYFCESLEAISNALGLSEDVAGATFMAAGSSAPELFTALVTIFFAPGDSGVGTIVGSAVFNLCVIVGLSCLCAGCTLDLFWWPLTRDSFIYFLSLMAMLVFMYDGFVTETEAAALTVMYVGYIAVMVVNPMIVEIIKRPELEKERMRSLKERAMAKVSSSTNLLIVKNDVVLLDTRFNRNASSSQLTTPTQDATMDEEAATARMFTGKGSTEEEEKEDSEAEEEEEGTGVLDIIALPLALAMKFTIPDCREERFKSWYFVTFTMSIVWIGLLSFVMVDTATRASCILEIPELIVGLLVLSVGTSVPDALSSIIVAKEGKGDMAVCNALGSNIFNILLGLGLPWWVKISQTGEPYPCPDFSELGEPMILLVGFLAMFLIILQVGNWKLKPSVGYALLGCQALYTVWTLLRNMPVGHPIIVVGGK